MLFTWRAFFVTLFFNPIELYVIERNMKEEKTFRRLKKIYIIALTFYPLPRSVDRAVCDARQIPSPFKF